MKKRLFVVLCATLALVLAGAAVRAGRNRPTGQPSAVEEPPTKEQRLCELDTTPVTVGEDLCFSFSLSDFISQYNAFYSADNGEEYLRPEPQWTLFADEHTPFSESRSRYYRFNYDEAVLTFPTISVYMLPDSDHVQGITIDFDDHGYSSYQFEMYESQCFYALKALFPNLDDSTLVALYTELIDHAYENIQTEGLSAQTVPDVVFVSRSIAVFSHFAFGDYVNLCIVPMDKSTVEELRDSGAEVRSVEALEKTD